MPYHLYAELGNTNLHLALWRDAWLHESRFPADSPDWPEAISALVAAAGLAADNCASAVLCASTPRRGAVVEGIRRALRVTPRLFGWDVTVAMPVAYDDPTAFGQDRLLAAFAASELVGGPCIVMDAGTCITCEAVTEKGQILPIAIVPGLYASLNAMFEAAPHLAEAATVLSPEEVLHASLPARSTRGSLALGLRCQLGGLAQQFISAGLDALRTDAPVAAITTGGDGALLAQLLDPLARHEPLLALDGLRLLDQRGPK